MCRRAGERRGGRRLLARAGEATARTPDTRRVEEMAPAPAGDIPPCAAGAALQADAGAHAERCQSVATGSSGRSNDQVPSTGSDLVTLTKRSATVRAFQVARDSTEPEDVPARESARTPG